MGHKVVFLGQDTNNIAEFHELIEGLLLCRSLGISNVEIEGDSTIIVNEIRTRDMPN